MQPRGLGSPIPCGDADQDVLRRRFRILHKHVEVAALAKYSGVNQLILGIVTRALCVFIDQLRVRKCRLGIFVQKFQVGARRRGVEIVVVLLDVLAMIPFAIREAEEPLLQDRVLFIPESQSEADVLMAVADATQAVLTPTIGARTSMIVREIVPRVAVRTVVLADRSPLPLGEMGPPAIPVGLSLVVGNQPLFFIGHSLASARGDPVPAPALCQKRSTRAFYFSRSSVAWQGSSLGLIPIAQEP